MVLVQPNNAASLPFIPSNIMQSSTAAGDPYQFMIMPSTGLASQFRFMDSSGCIPTFNNGMMVPQYPSVIYPTYYYPVCYSLSIVYFIVIFKPSTHQPTFDNLQYKTTYCHKFQITGTCEYGDKCRYAHGIILKLLIFNICNF